MCFNERVGRVMKGQAMACTSSGGCRRLQSDAGDVGGLIELRARARALLNTCQIQIKEMSGRTTEQRGTEYILYKYTRRQLWDGALDGAMTNEDVASESVRFSHCDLTFDGRSDLAQTTYCTSLTDKKRGAVAGCAAMSATVLVLHLKMAQMLLAVSSFQSVVRFLIL